MATSNEMKYKILVVDDNNENIRIIGSILRQDEYQVGFATGGQQALDILQEKEQTFDLVLLDVNMPEINGFEVCKIIRKNSLLKDLPVIFLTANAEPEQIIEGFASGGQDYVTKPFHAGELLSRISTHIELKEKRHQLENMNAILEEKVKKRTQELELSNRKLEVAYEKLEKLDSAKDEFLQIISHEINTPLNGIIGFAEMLKNKLKSTEYFRYINVLYESANRLNDFARTSLIITQLRTSPEKYKIDIINFSEIINDVIVELQPVFVQKKIQVNSNHTAIDPIIKGNGFLIHACILNLLKNAIHYTPTEKTISIDIFNENKHFIVSIEDSGPGFSAKAFQTQFEAFAPGEEHVNNNKGLGLSLVKTIVDFHHGQIDISNKSSLGARVVLSFNEAE